MQKTQTHQVILIVEDSDDDFEYTYRSLRNSKLSNMIHRCEDGDEALDYIYQRGVYNQKNAPAPSLILLDLNMPGLEGKDVLKEIKGNIAYKNIPIIVLTTSSESTDMKECSDLGANTYITKPIGIDNLFEAIMRLKDHWLEIAFIPNQDQQ